jgi:hypothetical protein
MRSAAGRSWCVGIHGDTGAFPELASATSWPAAAPLDPIPMGCPAWKARSPIVRPLTRRAGSCSSPWPARDRVLRRGASRGPARRCRRVAPRPCDDLPPTQVFASHTRSATCARRPYSPVPARGVVTRRRSCSADRRRPVGSSPTGTGPSTGIASGSRFRASSAARSMPNPSTCRGDPASSESTAAQTSSAARRKSRTTPASVSAVSASIPCRLIHPPVAPTRIAIQPERRPEGTNSAYLWKTCRPAIPKASPRTLAVTPRSALVHSRL